MAAEVVVGSSMLMIPMPLDPAQAPVQERWHTMPHPLQLARHTSWQLAPVPSPSSAVAGETRSSSNNVVVVAAHSLLVAAIVGTLLLNVTLALWTSPPTYLYNICMRAFLYLGKKRVNE
jgi:hypothetical protein